MSNTSLDLVKSYYGDEKLSEGGIDDKFLNTAILDAIMKVKIDGVGDEFKEYAQRLYVCHLITKRIKSDNTEENNISLEKIGPIQTQYKSYNGENKYDDPFEAEYQKLLDSLGLGYTVAKFI